MSPSPEIIYIKVQNTDLPAHRAKLCEQSPVFREILSKIAQPEINDIDVRVFKVLNRFIWKGEINPYSLDKYSIELLYAADKYKISTLKRTVEQYLISKLTPETVLERFHLSETLNCALLKSQCIEYVHMNAQPVLSTEQWQSLSEANPYFIYNLYQDLSAKYQDQDTSLKSLQQRQKYHLFYDTFYPALIYLTAFGVLGLLCFTFYLIWTQMDKILPTVITVSVLILCLGLIVERVVRNRPSLRQTCRSVFQRIGLVKNEPIYCTAEYHPSSTYDQV